jgi:hypothetical protein
VREKTYAADYNRGWRAGQGAGSGYLDRADDRGEPDAWYDGYLDAAAGRTKWHLRYCTNHHNGSGGCGEA